MEKINFVNGKAPALNATNLNQMQTNIENAIAANLNDAIEQSTNEVILWEGSEKPAGKTYTLNDNIYNYRFAIVVGQWGNKFVIPILPNNTYFNGGTNFPLGNSTGIATTGITAGIVNDGMGIEITYFRQLNHTFSSNHGTFEEPELYQIIGVK